MSEKVVSIETLVQDDHNFNKGTEAGRKLMERSFTELGAGRSILVDKDGRIIAGNKSQQAAIAAGIKKVRIIETQGDELVAVKRTDISLDSKEGRELALADNLTTQVNLVWEEAELTSVAAEQGIDLPDWGLDLHEIGAEKKAAVEDDFDEDVDPVEAICKTGDIWQLGEHRLMCGDSTDAENISALMQGEKADLWLTDPPYNVDYQGRTKDRLKIQNDKQDENKFFEFLKSAFGAAKGFLKEGAAFYIWYASVEHINFESALNAVGIKVREQLIWCKNALIFGRQDYHWRHEPCLYGWKEGTHNWYGDRKQTTVLEFDRPQKNTEHPTMKPVPLIAYQIQNSSKRNDIVLDTFGGSGTTLISCEQLDREARLMELDPHYCDVIIARWEKFTGQKAIKINN